jgi:hypothetical protein
MSCKYVNKTDIKPDIEALGSCSPSSVPRTTFSTFDRLPESNFDVNVKPLTKKSIIARQPVQQTSLNCLKSVEPYKSSRKIKQFYLLHSSIFTKTNIKCGTAAKQCCYHLRHHNGSIHLDISFSTHHCHHDILASKLFKQKPSNLKLLFPH